MRLTPDEIEHIQRTGSYESGQRTISMAHFKALVDTAQAAWTEPARPPVEHYARCSVALGRYVVEPGVELRDSDDFDVVSERLHALAGQMAGRLVQGTLWLEVARAFEDDIGSPSHPWYGRAWFLELHDANCSRWTQSYQPYGMPRWR